MKKSIQLILAVALVMMMVLALPSQVFAATERCGKSVFGEACRLASGETIQDNMNVFGGAVVLEEGSRVDGDLLIAGGTVRIAGRVTGDINAFGGSITLEKTAEVDGNINLTGAILNGADVAKVHGEVNTQEPGQFNVPFAALRDFTPATTLNFQPLSDWLWGILQTLAMAALALLVVMFFEKPTQRVASAVMARPAVTGGLGLLTVFVVPALIILVSITLILIPLGLVGAAALAIAMVFGWIAMGYELGNRMAAGLKTHWAAPVSGAVGTLALGLLTGLISLIPCVGWIVPFIVSMLGLGGVTATAFGSKIYPPEVAAQAAPAPAPVYSMPTEAEATASTLKIPAIRDIPVVQDSAPAAWAQPEQKTSEIPAALWQDIQTDLPDLAQDAGETDLDPSAGPETKDNPPLDQA
jgi:hypothetical protein